jgi:hypothetical protein
MKKILKLAFTLSLMISFSTTFACGTCGCQESKTNTEISKDTEKKQTADKKAKACCKSDNKKSSCSKSKKGSFNFNKSNTYGKKSSCSKSEAKKCCKMKAEEKEITEDLKAENKNSNK